MCCICESGCCRRWFPEWTRETSKTIFCIKLVIILILSCLVFFGFSELDNAVFDTARLTWETVIYTVIYCLFLAYLVVIYWPYQRVISPMWLQIIIYLIWLIVTIVFFLNGWLKLGLWKYKDEQLEAFDYWTIGHTLSGIVLGFMLPWWWCFGMLTLWEVLEIYTTGLGDGESDWNHLVDIIVAIIGWWIVILIFKKSRHDIPWISSRNSCGNEGRCCWDDKYLECKNNPSNSQPQSSEYNGYGVGV